MAEVIQFPKRTETQTLHFDEKHAFGEIGGLMLSLLQEQDKADAPYTLVLFGGNDVFEFEYLPRANGPAQLQVLGVRPDEWARRS